MYIHTYKHTSVCEGYSESKHRLFYATDIQVGTGTELAQARYRHMTNCRVNQHLTGHLVFVLVSTERATICPAIDNPANCEIRAVIGFLHAKNMSTVEIHCELCAVCGQT
jgi:hypothetical protein